MATLTLTQMLAESRYEMGDTDSANYGIDDTTLTALLNKCYIAVKGMQDDRTQFIASATTGIGATLANVGVVLSTSVNIRRIIAIYPSGGGASTTPTGAALERWPDWRAWTRRGESATLGSPTAFSAERQSTTTAASVGKWLVTYWRIPDATYDYVTECVVEPTALAGATDKPDVDDQASYAIAWMAAGIGCRLLGRNGEFIAHVEAKIPASLKAAYESMDTENIVP